MKSLMALFLAATVTLGLAYAQGSGSGVPPPGGANGDSVGSLPSVTLVRTATHGSGGNVALSLTTSPLDHTVLRATWRSNNIEIVVEVRPEEGELPTSVRKRFQDEVRSLSECFPPEATN